MDVDTWAAGGLTAALGAAGLWLANRLVGKAAVQTALNGGFKELMTRLEEDRDYWRNLVTTERQEHAREINEMKVAHAKEVAHLDGQILNLTQGYESLKNIMRRQGYDIPSAPMQVREMTVLESPNSEPTGQA